MTMTKKEVQKNIDLCVEQINGMYYFIDELNGYLDELLSYGGKVVKETDNHIDHDEYTNTYDQIKDFYAKLPTYHCLDDFKDLLQLLKEDIEEKEEVK